MKKLTSLFKKQLKYGKEVVVETRAIKEQLAVMKKAGWLLSVKAASLVKLEVKKDKK